MANDRLTEFNLLYDMSDITALKDSTPSTTFNKSFADISLLKNMIETPGQMTLEHNYCVLDGQQEEFDDEPDTIAFFTDAMSDDNGDFAVTPYIDISFTEMHSSFALTISFIDDYPLQIKCTWYQSGDVVFQNIYNVTENNFIVPASVSNYNAIRIEFLKALPKRYVKINFIRYGVLINWTENELKSGKLLLERDMLSSRLSNNALTFEVIDPKDQTNPGNAEGLHNYFQKTQIMYPYEMVNDRRVDLGRYFLKDFSYSKNLCKVNAVSYLGLFENVQYDKGVMYNGITAGALLADIFSTLEIDNYEIDSVTANTLLYGTLVPTNCKQAIQQILFACNSIIDTTNVEKIKILKSTSAISGIIERSTKMNTKVTRTDYVSGVAIKYSTYQPSSQNSTEVVKNVYEAGDYKVVFTTPYRNYTITNGTITNSSTFFVEFTVSAESAQVIIEADGYDVVENKETVSRDYIEGGEGENVKEFTTTLCNAQTAKALAAKILTHYDNRLEIDIKHIINSANINERWIVQNSSPGMDNYVGNFTKRSIDLVKGFIDTATMVGYYDKTDYNYYMDNEIIMDDNVEI